MPQRRTPFLYLLVGLALLIGLNYLLAERGTAKRIPYSEFRAELAKKGVEEVVISGDELRGVLKAGKKPFVTTAVDPELADELDTARVRYRRDEPSGLLTGLMSWLFPFLLMLGLWMLIMRRMAERGEGPGGGGLMAIGRSKAKVYVETDTKVSFDDVAGVDEAKAELQEIVNFLKDPASYGRLGARMPKGVLLVGPPGTGKTLLARAVAGEASVPFFSISGSEFVEMFVGVGAARVRDLFEQARQKAPSIIFVDELDALGRARMAGSPLGGHDEKEQTLNQLLVELDGFDSTSGLVLLAATNRPEILDPALLRAGRFDRQVLVDRPDKRGRVQILEVHVKKAKLADDVSLVAVAELTPGFTGADLANLVNEAALVATRRGADAITTEDFTRAIERIVAGLEKKNRLLNEMERRVVAYHEMGHALCGRALGGTDEVHKVSIIPRGIGALGYTLQRPTEERFLMTRDELMNKMSVLLGGRAAERLIFDHLSTGAADDLAKTTEIAHSMVTRYAMVPELGNVTYVEDPPTFLGGPSHNRSGSYSEQTACRIDGAVRQLVDTAYERAMQCLIEYRAVLEKGALELLERETLDADGLKVLFGSVPRLAARGLSGARPSGLPPS
jgi:cell division protease FtsH